MSFNCVPQKYHTYDLCLEAIKHKGALLKNIPENYKTYDLCLEAIKIYGMSLKYVPENLFI